MFAISAEERNEQRDKNKIEHVSPKKTEIIQKKKNQEENLKVFLLVCSEYLKTFLHPY